MACRRFAGITALLCAFSAGAAAREARADTCSPARLMVVLDKSSSMQTGFIAGQTKWSIAVDALDQVATTYEEAIELGLMVFPQPNECSPGTVRVSPALGNRDAIMSELVEPPPDAGNWTPMSQTLEAAAAVPSLNDPSTPRYAVLITDGWQWCSPYDPATRFDPVDAVTEMNAAGIKTYVVGFGGSVDALTLNQVAVTAGTARPGCDPTGDEPSAPDPCYYQADDPDELLDALNEVVSDASGEICDGEDNDCDGEVDEGLLQPCATDCGFGTEACVDGQWADCSAAQPEEEVCDGVDNDCDGTIDPGCDCDPGEERACGGDQGTGACQGGTQRCQPDGTWGECEDAVDPGSEMCNGLDDDCDGVIDEAAGSDDDVVLDLCGPGYTCEDGNCDPVDPDQPPGDENPADGGGLQAGACACGAGGDAGSAAGTALLMLLALAGLRRRRAA